MDKAQTTNEWIITKTTGIAPGKRREINDVINNETRKFYAFSGLDTNDQNVVTTFNMNILDINSYDTKVDRWSTMVNSSFLDGTKAPDERIIVFGGNKDDIATPVLNPLAVLNTKVVPYEWSVPTPAPPLPLTTNLHSATLNSTTVNTSSTGLSVAIPVDNGKQIGIIIGAVGLSWS
ncbi:hypothetical protein GLOIN_2v1765336 [Rhizophagus irregularis DAOM 181602=DAOM 197198]|nr:hypothetical protein GLOIN_2v1765336 [Rhizophagus irregularis DAOM 181602=DAOM 197198]